MFNVNPRMKKFSAGEKNGVTSVPVTEKVVYINSNSSLYFAPPTRTRNKMDSVFLWIGGYFVLGLLLFLFAAIPTQGLRGSAYNTAYLDVPSLATGMMLAVFSMLLVGANQATRYAAWFIAIYALLMAGANALSAALTWVQVFDCGGGDIDPCQNYIDAVGTNTTVTVPNDSSLNQAELYACNNQEYLLYVRGVLSGLIGLTSVMVSIYMFTVAGAVQRDIQDEIDGRQNGTRTTVYRYVDH